MCKVLVMTGIEDSDAALDFMEAAEPEMSKFNMDGIGYSAVNSKNELFMEKWHKNKQFLNTENVLNDETIEKLQPSAKKLGKYVDVPELKTNYMSYGKITRDDLRTVTMHTRMATCGREMKNTHPFVDQGVSLIHNGVINNQYALGLNKISTCDSEVALQLYINEDVVNGNVATFQGFVDQLKGYWAFAILAKNSDGQYMLDVVREGAHLYFAKVKELGENCYVFATTSEIIKTACITCGFTVPQIDYLKELALGRFNAVTGELLVKADLKKSRGNGYSHRDTEKREDFETSAKRWLSDGKSNTTKVNLITTSDSTLVYGELTTDEYDFFDLKNETDLTLVLQNYDDFMGSNFAAFFETMPSLLQESLEKRKNSGKLRFVSVLKIIEEFNARGNANAYIMLQKLG